LDINQPAEKLLPQALRRFGPMAAQQNDRTLMPWARSIGFDKLFGEERIQAFHRDPKLAEQEAAKFEKIESIWKKNDKPGDAERLRELKSSWVEFTATVQASLTGALAQVAPFLSTVSKGATKLVPSGAGGWLSAATNPAGYLAGKAAIESLKHFFGIDTEKKLKEWGDQVRKFIPSVETFKGKMDELVNLISEILSRLNPLKRFWDWMNGKGDTGSSSSSGSTAQSSTQNTSPSSAPNTYQDPLSAAGAPPPA